jgi:hypothetical protein
MQLVAKLLALAAIASAIVAFGAAQSGSAAVPLVKEGPIMLAPDLTVTAVSPQQVKISNNTLFGTPAFTVRVQPGWLLDSHCDIYVPAFEQRIASLPRYTTIYVNIPYAETLRQVKVDYYNEVVERNEANNTATVPATSWLC